MVSAKQPVITAIIIRPNTKQSAIISVIMSVSSKESVITGVASPKQSTVIRLW